MIVRELIELLEKLDPDMHIYIAVVKDDEAGEIQIEPVVESCDDDTVIGYMVHGSDIVHPDRIN